MAKLDKLNARQILIWLAFAGVLTSLISLMLNPLEDQSFSGWLDGWLQNLSTELVGAVLTYALFTLFIGTRENKDREKKLLIAQMGDKDSDKAARAVRSLIENGWLSDGTLQSAFLNKANLEGIPLHDADLAKANLDGANLRGAKLNYARLNSASLVGANLEFANLEGVDLRWARITNSTKFNENTWLPDMTRYNPNDPRGIAQLERFIDPNHPDYRSEFIRRPTKVRPPTDDFKQI